MRKNRKGFAFLKRMKNFVCLVLTLFTFELKVTLFNYLEKFKPYLQVNNFQKVFLVYHYVKELEQNFYIKVLLRAAVKFSNPGGE